MSLVEDKPHQSDELHYHGRKTSRSKSEQRRMAILEASLRVVMREGVRGIRHRAIAKEACVPLAATTYYFKDIQQLINDTFTLYTQKALTVIELFTQHIEQPLMLMIANPNGQALSLDDISEQAVNIIMLYHRDQIEQHRDMLIIEQAFRYEAITNQDIRKLAILHRQTLSNKLTDMLTTLQSPAPQADAELLLGLFHSLEYTALLTCDDPTHFDSVRPVLSRFMGLLVPNLIKA